MDGNEVARKGENGCKKVFAILLNKKKKDLSGFGEVEFANWNCQ